MALRGSDFKKLLKVSTRLFLLVRILMVGLFEIRDLVDLSVFMFTMS